MWRILLLTAMLAAAGIALSAYFATQAIDATTGFPQQAKSDCLR